MLHNIIKKYDAVFPPFLRGSLLLLLLSPLDRVVAAVKGVGTRYAGSTFNTTIVTPVATISLYVTGTPGFPPSIHFTFLLFFIFVCYLITDFVVFFFICFTSFFISSIPPSLHLRSYSVFGLYRFFFSPRGGIGGCCRFYLFTLFLAASLRYLSVYIIMCNT